MAVIIGEDHTDGLYPYADCFWYRVRHPALFSHRKTIGLQHFALLCFIVKSVCPYNFFRTDMFAEEPIMTQNGAYSFYKVVQLSR